MINTNTKIERLIFNYEFKESLKKRILKKIGVIANNLQLHQLLSGEKVIFKKLIEFENVPGEYVLTQNERKVIGVKDKYCKQCGKVIFGNHRQQYCGYCKKFRRKLSTRNAMKKTRSNVSNQLPETVAA